MSHTTVRSTPDLVHPASTTIEHVVRKLQAGEEWEHNARLLFKRCFRLVRRYFLQRGCSAAEAEDLVQETFLRVYRGLAAFRHESRFETWLLRIAGNVDRARHVRRTAEKRSAQVVPLDVLGDNGDGQGGDGVTVLERLLAREQAIAFGRALEEMPPQMRRCVLLRCSQQLQYREIAEILEISVEAVKVQLFRARDRLRRDLAIRVVDAK